MVPIGTIEARLCQMLVVPALGPCAGCYPCLSSSSLLAVLTKAGCCLALSLILINIPTLNYLCNLCSILVRLRPVLAIILVHDLGSWLLS
jgi:hypothetical protein